MQEIKRGAVLSWQAKDAPVSRRYLQHVTYIIQWSTNHLPDQDIWYEQLYPAFSGYNCCSRPFWKTGWAPPAAASTFSYNVNFVWSHPCGVVSKYISIYVTIAIAVAIATMYCSVA